MHSRDDVRLANLIDMENPDAMLQEVHHILLLIHPDMKLDLLDAVFEDVIALFEGRYPGYQASNAVYHSLIHTIDTFLALARLIHGATLAGFAFSEHDVVVGLISALLHDTGYIQAEEDSVGTGAKYTKTHITRSIAFMRDYYRTCGLTEEDFERSACILRCTGLDVRVDSIEFPSRTTELLGKMLGVADLLGQMADRHYLEKLPCLYREFEEGGVTVYGGAFELLANTPAFREMNKRRFAEELESMDKVMLLHFKERWGIDRDLYVESIERHMSYLRQLLGDGKRGYERGLRRVEHPARKSVEA